MFWLIIVGFSALSALIFALFLWNLLRLVRRRIFNYTRPSHSQVLEERQAQKALPEDFFAWEWTKVLKKSPWRGEIELEYSAGSREDRTVIFVHGTGTNRYSMVRYLQPYRDLGFNLVLFDHPGQSPGDRAFSSYGWYEKGELAWVTQGVEILFPKTALMVYHGESLGASTIMEYLGCWEPKPGLRRLGICDAGYTDFSQVLDMSLGQMGVPRGLRPWILKQTGILMARTSLAPLESLKPGKSALVSRDPLLLIHGMDDIRVPPVMTQELATLRRDSSPTEVYLVPGARHCKSWLADPRMYDARVRTFIVKYGLEVESHDGNRGQS